MNRWSRDPSTTNWDVKNVPSKISIGSLTDPKDAVAIPLVTVVLAINSSEIENTISESLDRPTHTRPGCSLSSVLVEFAVTSKETDALDAVFERGT